MGLDRTESGTLELRKPGLMRWSYDSPAGKVFILDSIVDGEVPSTKQALAQLAKVGEQGKLLVVLHRNDDVTWLSLRNVAEVHVLAVDQLNTYDVLVSDDVVFTKGAYDAFVGGTAKAAPAETAEPVALVDAPAAAEERSFEGAVKAEADGSGPEGYEIKGNADSMLYHAPGGRWYDATVAEFWFQTAADAEAAGFSEAGKKKSEDAK